MFLPQDTEQTPTQDDDDDEALNQSASFSSYPGREVPVPHILPKEKCDKIVSRYKCFKQVPGERCCNCVSR